MPGRDAAHLRQRPGKVEHAIELLLSPSLAPTRVVQVLPAPGGVGAHGLDVAVHRWTDPHVGPGRRDGERAEALDSVGIAQRSGVLVEIFEATAAPAPVEPGARAVDAAQTHAP